MDFNDLTDSLRKLGKVKDAALDLDEALDNIADMDPDLRRMFRTHVESIKAYAVGMSTMLHAQYVEDLK